MENKLIVKILSKYYQFSYPIYSGGTVTCIECNKEYWMTGKEFKANINDGFRKIFMHDGACGTYTKFVEELNQKSSSHTIKDIAAQVINSMRKSYPKDFDFHFRLEEHTIMLIVSDCSHKIKRHESYCISLYSAKKWYNIGDILIYHYENMVRHLKLHRL